MGWRDEVLLDVQVTHPQLTLAQRKIVDLVTKATAGAMIAYTATAEIITLIERARQDRKVIRQ